MQTKNERPIRARVSGLVSVKHAVASTPKVWKIAINRVSALDLRIKKIDVYGDSSLIIFQTTGDWKTKKKKLIPYHQYLEDISQTDYPQLSVSRTKNQFADALATLIRRRY